MPSVHRNADGCCAWRASLAPCIGSPSKVSEVLRRKRPLSITMIRNLHEGLRIPAATLIQAPGKATPAG